MRPRKPPPEKVLLRAVEARAQGKSWEATARLVQRAPETVRRWPHRYAPEWADALRAAERRVMDESADEAVSVLRTLLRSKDDALRHLAAWRLIYQRLFQTKLDIDVARINAFASLRNGAFVDRLIKGLSDEQLAQQADGLRIYKARPRPLGA